MLSILLLILKIIGIIVLSIIGLALLIILIVLFVPIRYKINISRNDIVTGHAVVSWIAHILHFSAAYEEQKLKYYLYIFGFPVKRFPGKETVPQVNNSENEASQTDESDSYPYDNKEIGPHTLFCENDLSVNPDESLNNSEPWDNKYSNNSSFKAEKEHPITPDNPEEDLWKVLDVLEENNDVTSFEFRIDQNIHDITDTDNKDKEKTEEKHGNAQSDTDSNTESILLRLSRFINENYNKIKALFKRIKNTIFGILNKTGLKLKKAEGLYNKIINYEWLITSYEFQSALKKCWRNLLKILQRLLPKNLYVDLDFGMSEPDETGYLMALLSILSGKIRGNYKLRPDFNQEVFNGFIIIKGRIIVIELIIPALKVLFDENVRNMYRKLTGKEKSNKTSNK